MEKQTVEQMLLNEIINQYTKPLEDKINQLEFELKIERAAHKVTKRLFQNILTSKQTNTK